MYNHDNISKVVWHKSVLLKVSICAWRLLRNRWPTKDNLRRRGVIPLDSLLWRKWNSTTFIDSLSNFWFSLATCEALAWCLLWIFFLVGPTFQKNCPMCPTFKIHIQYDLLCKIFLHSSIWDDTMCPSGWLHLRWRHPTSFFFFSILIFFSY